MKNRFISLFLALAMVFVSLTPVMADDNQYVSSPNQDGVYGEGGAKIGSEGYAKVVSDRKALEDETEAYIVVSTVDAAGGYTKTIQEKLNSKGVDAFLSDYGIKSKSGYKFETVALFDVDANQKTKDMLKKAESRTGTITIYNVAGVNEGDELGAYHFTNDSDYEPLECVATGANTITIGGLSSFSPVLIVKRAASSNSGSTTTTTDTSSTNTSKVVTCEDENGKGWVWSESKKACVYKVTNTGAK